MARSRGRPQRRPTAPRGRPGPAGRGGRPRAPQPPPAASARRAALERHSRPLLAWLAARPRWVAPLVLGALVLLGLFLPGPGAAVPLLVVAAFLGWLLALSWPAIDGRGRLARGLAVLVVLGAAAWRATA